MEAVRRPEKEPGFSARHAENDRLKKIGQPIKLTDYRMTVRAERAGKSALPYCYR
jgi:hypothetical protein